MPDASHRRECEERLQEAAGEGPLGPGIRYSPNKQSYIVNIRPKRWKDKFKPSQFWKGKIKDRRFAMLVADTIFHYCGKERHHFGDNTDFTFPSLRTLRLSTPAERSNYVESIAGSEFCPQRKDFIDQVMAVLNGPDFILRGEAYLGIAPAAEVAAAPALPAAQVAAAPALPAAEVAAAPALPAAQVPPAPAPPAAEVVAAPSSEECGVDFEEDAVAMAAQVASGAQPRASIAGFELHVGWGSEPGSPARIQSVPQHVEDWYMSIRELNTKCVMADPSEVFTSTAVDIATSPVFGNISFEPGTNFLVIG